MNKAKANQLGAEVAKAMEEIGKRHSLTVKAGGGSYDPISGTYKPRVEFYEVEIDGKPRGQSELEQWGSLYGLTGADYGKTFAVKGVTYTLDGINANRPKFPIRVKMADGKTTNFVEAVVRMINPKVRS